jgi:hypothetical protein
MNNIITIVIISLIGIGILISIAYWLDQRANQAPLPPHGPVGQLLLWIARILIALMIFSAIGAFIFQSLLLLLITIGSLGLYILTGITHQVVRRTGK